MNEQEYCFLRVVAKEALNKDEFTHYGINYLKKVCELVSDIIGILNFEWAFELMVSNDLLKMPILELDTTFYPNWEKLDKLNTKLENLEIDNKYSNDCFVQEVHECKNMLELIVLGQIFKGEI